MKIKHLLFFIAIIILHSSVSCEDERDVRLAYVCDLEEELVEISGIIPFGDNLIGIGDSGSKNSLFEINNLCSIVNEYNIPDVNNTDWEAIAISDSIIYLGNFGNNFGDRTDLEIIKIEVENLAAETPILSRISFTYEDQDNFENREIHNFDCEAMMVVGANIFLFTKNRANRTTHVYSLNILETQQVARRVENINISRLVTDAFYYEEENAVLFTAYEYSQSEKSFLNNVYISDYDEDTFISFPVPYDGVIHRQVESICVLNNEILVASEAENGDSPLLFSADFWSFRNQ